MTNGVTLTLGPSTAAVKTQIERERSLAKPSDLGIPVDGNEANGQQLKEAQPLWLAKAALAH